MKLNLRVVGILIVASGLLSQAALAADATIIQLGNQLSLQLLRDDRTTRTQAWAVANNGNLCNYPHDFNNHPSTLAIVTFLDNPQLLEDDIQTQRVLEEAIATQKANCPLDQYSRWGAVAVNKRITTIDNQFARLAADWVSANQHFNNDLLARRRQGYNVNDYTNIVADQHKSNVRATQETQRQQSAQQQVNIRLQQIVDKNSARGWIKSDQFFANPYSTQGGVFLFNSSFVRMTSPTTAVFSISGHAFVVTDIPNNSFTVPTGAVVVGRVQGTTNMKNAVGGEESLPQVKLLDVVCRDPNCGPYLRSRLR